MASKYDKAREALDELMDALRRRHSVLCHQVAFLEERHDPSVAVAHQGLLAYKHFIDLGDKAVDALRSTGKAED